MYAAEDTRRVATLDALRRLTRSDMDRVDALIRESLQSDVLLVSQVAEYIIGSGGKRLRPLLVLLGARALAYDGDEHIRAAAIIEFIHTATLLHDDVVDASDRRRGRHTANHVFGNQASVLVGDFLYSRSFQMMVRIGDMQVMDILADATNTIAAGEVMQLMNVHDPDTTEERYLEVIYRKTAKLFEAGAAIAAVLAGQPPDVRERMAEYGRSLGAAFQLVDDALDYKASPDELGKDLGDDLAEGKPTLPLIHAMSKGTPEQRRLIRAAIENGGLDNLAPVQAAIESTGALEYTAERAQRAADDAIAALADLPPSDYKDALIAVAEFAVNRRS
ncbi:octaprenyl diphosphate synthase [Lentisalinibacter sediminis]|uniref:octaprenyl diphosphate synthase n=1 Tax=Lentisalinibacter sediminis TaxID=2992237 RepID=UPI00386A8732